VRYREAMAGVSVEEALAEACPTCEAKPGDPCTYEHDLFTYSRGPAGRTKQLAHSRGEPLASGVHNARLGIVKARHLEAWRATNPVHGARPKEPAIPVAEMARRYQAGQSVPVVAAAARLSTFTTRRRLREAGVRLRPSGSLAEGAPVAETLASDERIARLYRGGAAEDDIAVMEDVSRTVVRNALRRQGVELRVAGEGGNGTAEP
jgi:hypothetical protein